MSAALSLLAWAGLGLPWQDVGAAGKAGEHAFLELASPRTTCYVHEQVRVELRFGFEREFLEQRLIQPFQRRLDVPAQLHAAWLEGLACAEPLPAVEVDGPGASFALEEAIARARRAGDEQRDGRTFSVFVLERDYHLTCAGPLELAAPYLRFAYATRFDSDVFGERVPVDRHDEVVAGRPLRIEVLPLPEEGRPPGFTGAVGRFRVRAEASPRELLVGESLKLALTVEGEGCLDHFDPPRLEPLEGLRVLGWVEEPAPQQRTVVYDLVPLTERVTSIPPLSLPYFDPGPPAGYRRARTEAIALTVRPRPDGATDADPTDAGPAPAAADGPDGGGLRLLVLGAATALLLLLAGVVARRRKRPVAPQSVDPAATRAAVQALQRRAAEEGVDVAQALAEYLAGRLACPVPAVIAPDLGPRLERAGVRREDAAQAARVLDALIAARYGGGAPPDAAARAAEVIERLEPTFQARPSPR